jgi:hypothetical protein
MVTRCRGFAAVKKLDFQCVYVVENPTGPDVVGQANGLRHGIDAELAAKRRPPTVEEAQCIGPLSIQNKQQSKGSKYRFAERVCDENAAGCGNGVFIPLVISIVAHQFRLSPDVK